MESRQTQTLQARRMKRGFLHGLVALVAASASVPALAQKATEPVSKDALFDLKDDPPAIAEKGGASPLPDSKEALFGDDLPPARPGPAAGRPSPAVSVGEPSPPAVDRAALVEPTDAGLKRESGGAATPSRLRGFAQFETARTYAGPAHWSKALGRLELGSQGKTGEGVQWKVSGRVNFNAIYDLDNFYQHAVRDDQRAEFQIRETYVDFSRGDWDWRLGRQNIVWGELVGMFLADVVSAKDLREFILPDFNVLRIPQWAARAEYFRDDFHAEVVWIPFPSYDLIGEPADFTRPGSGADFYPYPPVPGVPAFLKERTPDTGFSRGNFGVRLSQLKNGWDVSGFYYTSMNTSASYYPVAPGTYEPRHDRIWQLGGSLAKDMGPAVLKAEAVYTRGRRFNQTTDGNLVKQPMLDWAVGVDMNPDSDTRLNAQFFQSRMFDYDADILPDRAENGVSLLVSRALPNKWRGEILLMRSLNRDDWSARPKAIWSFQPNWKLTLGLDVFGGPLTGFFGQYDAQDRIYAELRHDF